LNLMSSNDVIELPILEVSSDEFWTEPAVCELFEKKILPPFLARARWYPEQSQAAIDVKLESMFPLSDAAHHVTWLAIFSTSRDDSAQHYLLPIQIAWTSSAAAVASRKAIAAVRQGTRQGVLLDVASSPEFITALLRNLRKSAFIAADGRCLEFKATAKFERAHINEYDIRAVSAEQSNSTTLVDHSCVVKIYRRLESGINPEVELGHFLSEVAEFTNTPALFGSIELTDGTQKSAVGVVHAFVSNRGDAWNMTAGYLDSFATCQRNQSESHVLTKDEVDYLAYMYRTGRRVGEMHVALACITELEDFAPEPVKPDDLARWNEDILARASRVFDAIRRFQPAGANDAKLLGQFMACERTFPAQLERLLPTGIQCMNIRHHGDFHLGQMLVAKDDVFIIDFEGEPHRPHAERRLKAPAARDVAGLIRSIDYSVGAAAERAATVVRGDDTKLASVLAAWRANATAAFLSAYWEQVEDLNIWPSDRTAADNMLKFFLLEKALYEMEYELAYRPHWLRIPLSGILRLLSDVPSETENPI
jgi:maltose alpha-D-glucosyltransferase / alpha-amylase